MKIFGFSSGTHDSSYCIYENNELIIHEELERLTRIKECDGDILNFYETNRGNLSDFDIITTFPHGDNKFYPPTMDKVYDLSLSNKVKLIFVGHHQAHAANAFFSSPYKNALIITIDGGGWDHVGGSLNPYTFTIWEGNENDLKPIVYSNDFNMGAAWSTLTQKVFKMSGGGPPYGCQAGTVMAMAAFGNPDKFYDRMHDVFTNYNYDRFDDIKENELFDFAASLQKYTEKFFFDLVEKYINKTNIKNLCLTGGVALNCVMCGKLKELYPDLNIYIPPVPYDAGLSIGCCQYVTHCVLQQPRTNNPRNNSAYLGKKYNLSDITEALKHFNCTVENASENEVLLKLSEEKIIAVYGEGSESGRRSLGNRSILADPRSQIMKQKVNDKVKHRKWFRPFAPSILREKVKDWFNIEIDSPYMSFALHFKHDMGEKVPAVNHKDNTARLQTVSQTDNLWYYNFLLQWEKISGVPILLNTSFNDREPIVETPKDAIACFLKTEIDYLYFREHNLLISK